MKVWIVFDNREAEVVGVYDYEVTAEVNGQWVEEHEVICS